MQISDTDMEIFYGQIKKLLKMIKKEEITVIMGDIHYAKFGNGMVDDICGDYGLGIRNDQGDRLIQFCQENMVITNLGSNYFSTVSPCGGCHKTIYITVLGTKLTMF